MVAYQWVRRSTRPGFGQAPRIVGSPLWPGLNRRHQPVVSVLPQDRGVGYAVPMSVTLCIDTSGAYCSLALAREGELFIASEELARQHNEKLLSMLDGLCQEAQIAPAEVDLLGYVHGPGSFTGVRLSASVIQAMALVSEASVVPLDMGELWAAQLGLAPEILLVSCTKSRADLYYLSGYRGLECLVPYELCDSVPEWAAGEPLVLAGEQPPWWQGAPKLHPLPVAPQTLLQLTEQRHQEGGSMAAESALPLYLATDSPWQKVGK